MTLQTPANASFSYPEGQMEPTGLNTYKSFVTGELTNNTNVRLSRQGTGTTVTAEWFVVKFNDETTIQTGETAVSTSNPTSQNIGSVDLSRSWLYFTWRATANGLGQDSPRGWLQTSTQIQWSRQTTTGTVYARWFVIQMPSGNKRSKRTQRLHRQFGIH